MEAANIAIPTKWSKEVSPVNALPNNPRPQMVRNEWTNLNALGLCDHRFTTFRAKPFRWKYWFPYPVESALSGVKTLLA